MLRPVEEMKGLCRFAAPCFPDERGFLVQSYVASDLLARGIEARFCQAIESTSRRGVVRGLHFQWHPPQGKLVRCLRGSVFDVVVDVRHGSPTLGDHAAVELSGSNRNVLWVPPGFAHGFMAMEEDSTVLYECTAEWNTAGEGGILWDEPHLQVQWPAVEAILSPRDRRLPTLKAWLQDPRSHQFCTV